jgi:indole-3-glycerol phosphate synthase
MILDEIVDYKKEFVANAKTLASIDDIKDQLSTVAPARDFRGALRQEGIRLIAEVKKASPSKGVMLEDVDALGLASIYEQMGASAISVLTDEKYFQGSLQDFIQVRRGVRIPCIRKEFIVDDYQIYESRLAQADAILLIVRILSDEQLREYRELAESLGMAALVETHDQEEIERALASGARIVGINNRDLQTFDVSYQRSLDLKKFVPGGTVLVSESGIHTREQVQELENGGIDAMLIGEAFVTSDDIAAKVKELLTPDAR